MRSTARAQTGSVASLTCPGREGAEQSDPESVPPAPRLRALGSARERAGRAGRSRPPIGRVRDGCGRRSRLRGGARLAALSWMHFKSTFETRRQSWSLGTSGLPYLMGELTPRGEAKEVYDAAGSFKTGRPEPRGCSRSSRPRLRRAREGPERAPALAPLLGAPGPRPGRGRGRPALLDVLPARVLLGRRGGPMLLPV